MHDSLGDRMKQYEGENILMPLLPVIIRLDGKTFHSFTRGLAKPFDKRLREAMVLTTMELCKETSAHVGYTQSDEISLALYSPTYQSHVYFNGNVNKIVSILAAKTTLIFNDLLKNLLPEKVEAKPVFDCRCFNVPTLEEGANYFIWRELDAVRNSIQMAGHSVYSHRELMNKNCDEIQEMLFQKGINWNAYEDCFKRGTYIARITKESTFSPEEINLLPYRHAAKTNPNFKFIRSTYEMMKWPILTKIGNRTGVLFDGQVPH